MENHSSYPRHKLKLLCCSPKTTLPKEKLMISMLKLASQDSSSLIGFFRTCSVFSWLQLLFWFKAWLTPIESNSSSDCILTMISTAICMMVWSTYPTYVQLLLEKGLHQINPVSPAPTRTNPGSFPVKKWCCYYWQSFWNVTINCCNEVGHHVLVFCRAGEKWLHML